MKKLIVVTNPKAWTLDVAPAEIISTKDYLTDPAYVRLKNVRVFNLSREYRYQSKGYYVSLLAEARGHKVIPSVKTIQDLKTPALVRIISDELDDLIQRSLRHIKSDPFVLSIYFGENVAKQHHRLAQELYKLFQAPFLRARFTKTKQWTLQSIRAIPMSEIPETHLDFVRETARRYFRKQRYSSIPADPFVYDLAILVNPDEHAPPSNKKALTKFAEAAEKEGFSVEFITRDDYNRVGEFDALFIRETTSVDHHTYRFARRAQSEGIPVIDDPDAILRCTNKVYLAELLQSARVRTPKTLIVHTENRDEVEQALGLPCVLKLPDSSFSQGVVKAATPEQLQEELSRMLSQSDLVIAQAYSPTDFDWRIGVLDGQPLYACKYYMAKDHWQIYNWKGQKIDDIEGDFETLPLDEIPDPILRTALRATRLIGDGLFGVDLKAIDGKPYLIEINDNPSLDAGVEDAALGDALYTHVIQALKRRIEHKRTAG